LWTDARIAAWAHAPDLVGVPPGLEAGVLPVDVRVAPEA
jgi:hypothetical protein